jgi:hypothetical protein
MKRRLFRILTAIAFLCLLLFLPACGLETYYVLSPTVGIIYSPGTIDPGQRYFYFRTNDSENIKNAGDIFLGTRMYYKIYASKSALDSAISAIQGSNTEYSSNGFSRIIQLDYQELVTAPDRDMLAPQSIDREVTIRLFNELYDTSNSRYTYEAAIIGLGSEYKPLRRTPYGKGFTFFPATNAPAVNVDAEKQANPLPVQADGDVNWSGYTDGKTWYVNAYVVSVGQDTSLAPLYSQLLHLGYIIIAE